MRPCDTKTAKEEAQMKNWIASLLAAALLVGIVPAAMAVETENEATNLNFQVGYGEKM